MNIVPKIARGPDDFIGRMEDIGCEAERIQGITWISDFILTENTSSGCITEIELHERVSYLNQVIVDQLEAMSKNIEKLRQDLIKRLSNEPEGQRRGRL